MMIKLSDGCWVAADSIAELKVNEYSHTITVRTKDGIGHCVNPNYGEGVYAALDRIAKAINKDIVCQS